MRSTASLSLPRMDGYWVGGILASFQMGRRNKVPYSIVKRAVQILTYHVPCSICLDDPLVGDSIRDVRKGFLFVYGAISTAHEARDNS